MLSGLVMPDPPKPGSIKHSILAFLGQNPGACDVLEGIGTFWVPRAKKPALEVALAELVAAGILRRVEVGRRAHYCLSGGGFGWPLRDGATGPARRE